MSHSCTITDLDDEEKAFVVRALGAMRALGHEVPDEQGVTYAGGPESLAQGLWFCVRHVWAECARCGSLLMYDAEAYRAWWNDVPFNESPCLGRWTSMHRWLKADDMYRQYHPIRYR